MNSKTRWSLTMLAFVAMFALLTVGASAQVAGLKIPGISSDAGGTDWCCNVGSLFGCGGSNQTGECVNQNICTLYKEEGCGFMQWFECNGYCKEKIVQ